MLVVHENGATIGGRTRDLILTMDALYQLSYRGSLAIDLANFNRDKHRCRESDAEAVIVTST